LPRQDGNLVRACTSCHAIGELLWKDLWKIGFSTPALQQPKITQYVAGLVKTTYFSEIAPTRGVDNCEENAYFRTRRWLKGLVGARSQSFQSKLGDQSDEETRWTTKPEKTNGSARSSWGLELRKQ
jgi:hypothetical protein